MRPSRETAAAARLAKLTRGEDERLVLKVTGRTREGVKDAARARRMSTKAFLLSLARDAGAVVDPADLPEDLD